LKIGESPKSDYLHLKGKMWVCEWGESHSHTHNPLFAGMQLLRRGKCNHPGIKNWQNLACEELRG
jgi:ABC-type sulfate transport system substrate-binding protein